MKSTSPSDSELIQTSAQKAANILGLFEWYDDLSLIRIYQSLYYHCGGDEVSMYHWFQTPNKFFKGKVPSNLVTTETGIQDVLETLILRTLDELAHRLLSLGVPDAIMDS